MFAIFSGLFAGAAHVWAGPDHLAAVAPLSARSRVSGWIPGLRWGVGHSIGVGVVGLLALGLRELLPLELLATWGERMVGVMPIGIGFWALRKALGTTIHVHEHQHDGSRHVHIHAHTPREDHASASAHGHSHAAVGIGLLHGVAGSSHFFGILPMLAFPTRVEAAGYLIAFAAGTILSMAAFSWLVALTAGRCARHRSARVYQGFMTLCGLAAMGVGCTWLAVGWQ